MSTNAKWSFHEATYFFSLTKASSVSVYKMVMKSLMEIGTESTQNPKPVS